MHMIPSTVSRNGRGRVPGKRRKRSRLARASPPSKRKDRKARGEIRPTLLDIVQLHTCTVGMSFLVGGSRKL